MKSYFYSLFFSLLISLSFVVVVDAANSEFSLSIIQEGTGDTVVENEDADYRIMSGREADTTKPDLNSCLSEMPHYYVDADSKQEWARSHYKLIEHWVEKNCPDQKEKLGKWKIGEDSSFNLNSDATTRYGLHPDCRQLAPDSDFNGTDTFAYCAIKAELLFDRKSKNILDKDNIFQSDEINKISKIRKPEQYKNPKTIITKQKNGQKFELIVSERELKDGQKKIKFSAKSSNSDDGQIQRVYVQIFPEPSENIAPASFSGNVVVPSDITSFKVESGEVQSYGAKMEVLEYKEPLGKTEIEGISLIKGKANVETKGVPGVDAIEDDEGIQDNNPFDHVGNEDGKADPGEMEEARKWAKSLSESKQKNQSKNKQILEDSKRDGSGKLDKKEQKRARKMVREPSPDVKRTESPLVPKGQCPLNPDQPYTYPGTNSIWQITQDGTRRPFQSSRVFKTHYDSYSQVQVTTKQKLQKCQQDEAGFVPWGPKYNPKGGALAKIPSDNKVYLLLDGKKYWIESQEVFNELDYKWGWVEDVDQELLEHYESAGAYSNKNKHPVGSLIKYPDSPKVYKIDKNFSGEVVKRHISNSELFKDLGYRFDRITTISREEQYKTGEPIKVMKNMNPNYYGSPLPVGDDTQIEDDDWGDDETEEIDEVERDQLDDIIKNSDLTGGSPQLRRQAAKGWLKEKMEQDTVLDGAAWMGKQTLNFISTWLGAAGTLTKTTNFAKALAEGLGLGGVKVKDIVKSKVKAQLKKAKKRIMKEFKRAIKNNDIIAKQWRVSCPNTKGKITMMYNKETGKYIIHAKYKKREKAKQGKTGAGYGTTGLARRNSDEVTLTGQLKGDKN
ncbi:MAG: hypothetical protein ABEJ02_02565 [Candidatus Paceibacteria bacterium]